VPDRTQFGGICDIFAVINIIEMSDIIHPKSYEQYSLPVEERLEMINGRKRARSLAEWIFARAKFGPDGPSMRQFFWHFLAHQARAVVIAKGVAEKRKVWSSVKIPIADKVEALVKRHFEGMGAFWGEWDALDDKTCSWFYPKESGPYNVERVPLDEICEGANILRSVTCSHISSLYRTVWLASRKRWQDSGRCPVSFGACC
jgi:hypothetical protein